MPSRSILSPLAWPDNGHAEVQSDIDLVRTTVMRTLTLRTKDGSAVRFKVGEQLAANAGYILTATPSRPFADRRTDQGGQGDVHRTL
jgi:hypothetical protein